MYVGKRSTRKARCTFRSRSRYCTQIILSFAIKSFHLSSSPSELTLIITKEVSLANRLFKSRNPGTDSTQGGHHVPQKSSSTTLPFNSSSDKYSPSEVVIEKSGAKGSRARRGLSIILRASSTLGAPGPSFKNSFSSAAPS